MSIACVALRYDGDGVEVEKLDSSEALLIKCDDESMLS